jgi:hypothetical protein
MSVQSEVVLDSRRAREVTGVFYKPEALEAAGEDLLLGGFDRSDIDVIAPPDEVRRKLGPEFASVPPMERADIPEVPRHPFVSRDDVVAAEAVFSGLLGGCVALATTLVMVWRGAPPLTVAIWAVFLGVVASVFGILTTRRQRAKLEGAVSIIWVRVDSDEKEAQAREILSAHDAHYVHVHEIELAKTLEDIPLSSLRPDPWLGNERLGHP